MIKKLTTIGNSLGVTVDRPILDLLNTDRDTPLEVRTDGEALIIRPAPEEHPAEAGRTTPHEEVVAEMRRRFGGGADE